LLVLQQVVGAGGESIVRRGGVVAGVAGREGASEARRW